MSGSLTCGGRENVPIIRGACATPKFFHIWLEAHEKIYRRRIFLESPDRVHIGSFYISDYFGLFINVQAGPGLKTRCVPRSKVSPDLVTTLGNPQAQVHNSISSLTCNQWLRFTVRDWMMPFKMADENLRNLAPSQVLKLSETAVE